MFTFIVEAAFTLIITRHLHKIASLRAVEAPTRKEVDLRDPITIHYSHIFRNIGITPSNGFSARAARICD
jgi:hypothetical protein